MLIFPGAYQSPGKSLPSTDFQPGQDIRGQVQDFRYQAEDGQALIGRLLQRESPQQTILFLHGNGIHAVDLDGWTHRVAAAADATVMTAEYRGFGTNETPSESMVIADAYAALQAMGNKLGVERSEITVYGRSLGGGIAAGLIGRLVKGTDDPSPVRALVLDRTFSSVLDIAQDRFPFIPMGLLLRNRFDSRTALSRYEGRVLQWHGDADRIVPLEYGQALHDALVAKPKSMHVLPGLAHNDALPPGFLRERLRSITGPTRLIKSMRSEDVPAGT
ncbi:MAG: alpha/beta hydrolase [Planctomycetota bacterium]